MKITRRECLMLLSVLPFCRLLQAAETNIEIWRDQWHDAARNRDVPFKNYYPKGDGPFPVIVFSHGLGGSRDGYEYLGRNWAQHGYVSVHLQHLGSDSAVWQGGDMKAMFRAANFQNALLRVQDVKFALDQLEKLNAQESPLRGKLDLKRIGMAGHSFGANTTLLVCGMSFGDQMQNQADPRIKAAIAMSSPMPATKNYDAIYSGIKIPILHMTGTKDTTPFDVPGSTAADRRLPFDHIRGADAYLITFKDGDHMLFSGWRRGEQETTDARYHQLIQQSSTAFWDAYLKNDATALASLKNDFARELGDGGIFEQK